MKQALGLVEVQGLSTAVVTADTMAKAANVQILEVENTKGSGYMTIKVVGDVGAVNASVQAGRQIAIENQKLVSWKVIPRPSDYIERTFCTPPTKQESVKEEPKQEAKQESVQPEPVVIPTGTEQPLTQEVVEMLPEPEAEPLPEIKPQPEVTAEPKKKGSSKGNSSKRTNPPTKKG